MYMIKSIIMVIAFITMIMNPSLVASSTLFAVNLWWNSVLPALLPFFIVSELLINFGIMKCLSIWLEPIMRPIFRLPGSSALAVVMGFVSGSPTGATITASLREQGLCTKKEGERLLAFTNNTSPLYILVAVAVGIFQSPQIGMILLLSHHPVNMLFGILLRFLSPKPEKAINHTSILSIAAKGISSIKCSPQLPIGTVLSNSVKKSLINIGIVGGFMVIFALVSAILEELQLIEVIAYALLPICKLFNMDSSLSYALASGFFEMSIGIAKLPEFQGDLLTKAVAASIILAWNGLSIQGQIASMIQHTDIKMKYYIIIRCIHSLIAPAIVILLAPYLVTDTFAGSSILAISISPILLLLWSIIALSAFAFIGLLLYRDYY